MKKRSGENPLSTLHSTIRLSIATMVIIMAFGGSAAAQDPFSRVTEGDIVTDIGRSQGIAWGDYDNDGYPDAFVTNLDIDNEQDNFLYRNNGDGTFTKITNEILVNDGGHSRGAAWGDYDNDGDLDLFVVNFPEQARLFYLNDGDGTFTKVTTGAAVNDTTGSSSPGWADYDRDGDLDLYIATSLDEEQGPYGECTNSLYRNDEGTLVEVTVGEPVTDLGASYCTAWCDYDADGDMDLFVTESTTGANQFYDNNGDGTFTKVTTGVVVNDVGESFSASWGDYDNDGDQDLFVTNVDFDSEGKNFLYRNLGNGDFEKITEGAVVNDIGYSFGSAWGDYDNDGDLDLFVANCPDAHGTRNYLYENLGDGTFQRVTTGVVVTDADWSYGAAWADYDRDGDLDLMVANLTDNGSGNALYLNNGNGNNWISIRCIGTQSNRSAIGTKVRIKSVINGSPVRQLREIVSQSGFCGQNDMNTHFGLGDAETIDSLVVEWPLGLTEVWTGVGVNQFLGITEGSQTVIEHDTHAVTVPRAICLSQNYPNPFNPSTTIQFEIPEGTGKVHTVLSVYDLRGKLVRTLVNGEKEPGTHLAHWDGTSESGQRVGSGLYFYRLRSGGFESLKRMVMVK